MNLVYFLPLIAALIGWGTNYLAIKMLFHPQQPINLYVIKIQGVFPKRQEAFAQQIAQMVVEELFSKEDIKEQLENSTIEREVKEVIEAHVDDFLNNRFQKEFSMLSTFINQKMINKFKGVLMRELESVLPQIARAYAQQTEQSVNIQETIRQKIADFPPSKIELMLYSIMRKEFQFVEIVGAVLGFLIGLIQVALVQV